MQPESVLAKIVLTLVWRKQTAQERVRLSTLPAMCLPGAADQEAANFTDALVPWPASRQRRRGGDDWLNSFVYASCLPLAIRNARIEVMSGPKSSAEQIETIFKLHELTMQ
jgi:hypothetical protein